MAASNQLARQPAVAGMFYPDDPQECRRQVEEFFANAARPQGNQHWIGALVPHAGWICSGQVAADAINWLRAAQPKPDVVVIFGAVHTVGGFAYGALDEHDAWYLPTGRQMLAADLQRQMLSKAKMLKADARVHRREHSIEVNVPLTQFAWPDIPLLPICVPPVQGADEIGRETASLLRSLKVNAVYLASSDLTHYGPDYGVLGAGVGRQALDWASVNDLALLKMIQPARASEIVDETRDHDSACGGGAIAAMLGACKELGANESRLIRHTNSYEVLSKAIGRQQADNFVGYAAMAVA